MSSCLLFAEDDEQERKINLDDLYQKQQQRDLKQLAVFNKILNRVYRRIETTNKMKRQDKHIWFLVPEFLFGEPVYDKGECIAYMVTKLQQNGFFIQYMHPSTLFVSWERYVPTYKRNEIKRKTGLVLNERGEVVDKTALATTDASPQDINAGLFINAAAQSTTSGSSTTSNEKKTFTPIASYKPKGQFMYHPDALEALEKKVTFAP